MNKDIELDTLQYNLSKGTITMKANVLLIMFAPYRTIQMQIAALSAFLKSLGCNVRYLEIIIFQGDTFDKYKGTVEKKVKEFQPDLVGFSSYDMNYHFILDCANFIKSFYPEVKIIVGGHHASLAPEDYMQSKAIDYVCIGEGERVLKDLLDGNLNVDGNKIVPGICFRDNKGKAICNTPSYLIENLEELPFIDRAIVNSQHTEIDYLPMLAGKGCPYGCTYCANDSIRRLYANNNMYIRYRFPERVIEEIKGCRERYKFKYVFFYDDIFALDYRWIQKFGELFAKNFPDINFICLLRPEIAANEKYLKLLYDSGCRSVIMGVESGSEGYRQKALNRKMTNQVILKAAKLIKKYKLELHIFMMVGMPGETIADMLKSLWLNFRIGAKAIQTGIYYPIKNTPLYEYCLDHNLINEKRKKRLFVYTYDTCLNYGFIKRKLIILFKWLNSGMPLVRGLQVNLILNFIRTQYKKWFRGEIDYS